MTKHTDTSRSGDLVKRLRELGSLPSYDPISADTNVHSTLHEAADRFEALEAALEQRERETVERIVAWLMDGGMFAAADYEIADAIEAGEWKQ